MRQGGSTSCQRYDIDPTRGRPPQLGSSLQGKASPACAAAARGQPPRENDDAAEAIPKKPIKDRKTHALGAAHPRRRPGHGARRDPAPRAPPKPRRRRVPCRGRRRRASRADDAETDAAAAVALVVAAAQDAETADAATDAAVCRSRPRGPDDDTVSTLTTRRPPGEQGTDVEDDDDDLPDEASPRDFGAALADALALAEDPRHAELLTRVLEDCVGGKEAPPPPPQASWTRRSRSRRSSRPAPRARSRGAGPSTRWDKSARKSPPPPAPATSRPSSRRRPRRRGGAAWRSLWSICSGTASRNALV